MENEDEKALSCQFCTSMRPESDINKIKEKQKEEVKENVDKKELDEKKIIDYLK
jgi:Pyruvate/2-oxoacid:ferredoxin oxidoreductase delta subunit